jgi:tetratricopeptide (TPR) repeat protein
LAVNPEDAEAYLVLGQSYLRLLADTRERAWGERLPELVKLRQAQASTALNQAIALKPDLAQAHLHLAWLYRATGCLDLALEHLRTYVELTHAAGPPRGVHDEPFPQPEARYQEQRNQLAQAVRDREDSYTAAAVRMRVLDRALLALQNGLAGKARDILLETDYAAFGGEGMALELELLLRTGRAKDVLKWLGPDQAAALGASAANALRVRALMALGDYALAREELNRASGEQSQGLRFRDLMALMVGQGVLDANPAPECLPSRAWQTFLMIQVGNRASLLAQSMRQEADLSVLRGLIALEEGDVDKAEAAFRSALAWWKDEAAAASGSGLDFRGRVIAQQCLEWLERARRKDEGW